MNKLRIAIIGQGRSGRDIHGAFLKTEKAKEHFEVVAIVEEIPSRAERAREEFACPVFASYTDLFDSGIELDLVVNSSFSYQHAAISIDLLKHGFNVLCEKPVCRNLEERTGLIAYLKEHDIVAPFHYLSLHKSDYYTKNYGECVRELPCCDMYADCLVRLPLFYELSEEQVELIINLIKEYYAAR